MTEKNDHETTRYCVCTGRLGGYRTMWRLLVQKHHLRVSHMTVRLMLRQMDPVGVAERQQHRLRRRTYFSHGPNDTWHVDGYDKLGPYGILISGYVHVLCC